VGELSKPEIYTDKTGKAQIQVEVTASALHFMPSIKGADGAKPAHTPSQSSFGEAQASGSDEELPF
jgi:single-stranded DNA-binding protein